MAVLKRDPYKHTYSDYLMWSGAYGDELINGTAFVREPPAPSPSHQAVVVELSRQLSTALKNKPGRVYVAPFDVRLPKSTEDDGQIDTVVQPDVLIVCDTHKIDARGMRGAPDWIAEVLSPHTASYDRSVKVAVYERAGVREVWLVDPVGRMLTIYQLEGERFGCPKKVELTGQTRIDAVPDVTVDWADVLAKV